MPALNQSHTAVNSEEHLLNTTCTKSLLTIDTRLTHHLLARVVHSCDIDRSILKVHIRASHKSGDLGVIRCLSLRIGNIVRVVALAINARSKNTATSDDDGSVLLVARAGLCKIARLLQDSSVSVRDELILLWSLRPPPSLLTLVYQTEEAVSTGSSPRLRLSLDRSPVAALAAL